MHVQVSEAEDSDMLKIFTITSRAFGKDEPFWNACWPKHWTSEGRVAGAERFKNIKNSDPCSKYIKAVNESTGEIIGMAKWNVFVNHIPNLREPDGNPLETWDSQDEKEYQEYMSHQLFAERRDAILMSNGNVVVLDILAVDPAFQRKRVGSALVEWGVNKADELGLEGVVEASDAGRRLYENHGFVWTKRIRVKVPQKWKHFGEQDYEWLVRPKESVVGNEGSASEDTGSSHLKS